MKKLISLLIVAAIVLFPTKALAGGITPPENLRLVKIECAQYPKAAAYFTWDPVAYATSYKFYSKVADGTDSYRSYNDDPTTPGYTFIFNPTLDFYVAVSAINTSSDNPSSSYETSKTEYFLSANKVTEICAQQAGKSIPPIMPSVFPSIVPSLVPTITLSQAEKKNLEEANAKVKEMEKKVNKLEQKVNETEKKQSAIEILIHKILVFLHLG